MAKKADEKKADGKDRVLKYVGPADRLDLRPVVGLAGEETDEARKFIFHRYGSRVDPTAGERQYREGVTVTEQQALALLTHPDILGGFADVTEDAPPLEEVRVLEAPVVPTPQGDAITGYETAPTIPVE